MAFIPGTNIASKIVPFDTADTFETHEDTYGKGGYRSVANESARNAIPEPRQQVGMLVHTQDDDKTWRLTVVGTPATFEELKFQPDTFVSTVQGLSGDVLLATDGLIEITDNATDTITVSTSGLEAFYDTQVSSLSGAIDVNSLAISDLETDVGSLSGAIDVNSLAISDLETTVDGLSGEYVNITGDTMTGPLVVNSTVDAVSGYHSLASPITTVSSTQAITQTIGTIIVDTAGGDVTVTIPDADGNNVADTLRIIKVGGNAAIVETTSSQNIGGLTQQRIEDQDDNKGFSIVANSTEWIVVQSSRFQANIIVATDNDSFRAAFDTLGLLGGGTIILGGLIDFDVGTNTGDFGSEESPINHNGITVVGDRSNDNAIEFRGNKIVSTGSMSYNNIRFRNDISNTNTQNKEIIRIKYDDDRSNETIVNAIDNGGEIQITTSNSHQYQDGNKVFISGVNGVPANGTWTVTRNSNNTMTLNGSTFSGSYVSGGSLEDRTFYVPWTCRFDNILFRDCIGQFATTTDGNNNALFRANLEGIGLTIIFKDCDALTSNENHHYGISIGSMNNAQQWQNVQVTGFTSALGNSGFTRNGVKIINEADGVSNSNFVTDGTSFVTPSSDTSVVQNQRALGTFSEIDYLTDAGVLDGTEKIKVSAFDSGDLATNPLLSTTLQDVADDLVFGATTPTFTNDLTVTSLNTSADAILTVDGNGKLQNSGTLISDIVTDPAGNDKQLQFNDNGSFGAVNLLKVDKTKGAISIGTTDDVAGKIYGLQIEPSITYNSNPGTSQKLVANFEPMPTYNVDMAGSNVYGVDLEIVPKGNGGQSSSYTAGYKFYLKNGMGTGTDMNELTGIRGQVDLENRAYTVDNLYGIYLQGVGNRSQPTVGNSYTARFDDALVGTNKGALWANGATRVSGLLTAEDDIGVTGQITIADTTAATSTTDPNAALVVGGGIAANAKSYLNGLTVQGDIAQFSNGAVSFSNISGTSNNTYALKSAGQITGSGGSGETNSSLYNTPSFQNLTGNATSTPVSFAGNRVEFNTTNNFNTAGITVAGVADFYSDSNYTTSIGGGDLTITNQYGYYRKAIGTLTSGVSIDNEYGIYLEDIAAGSSDNFAIYTNAGKVRVGDLAGTADEIVTVASDGTLQNSGTTIADIGGGNYHEKVTKDFFGTTYTDIVDLSGSNTGMLINDNSLIGEVAGTLAVASLSGDAQFTTVDGNIIMAATGASAGSLFITGTNGFSMTNTTDGFMSFTNNGTGVGTGMSFSVSDKDITLTTQSTGEVKLGKYTAAANDDKMLKLGTGGAIVPSDAVHVTQKEAGLTTTQSIDTFNHNSTFGTAEWLVVINDGTKTRSSRVTCAFNGNSVDYQEDAIVELGGAYAGVTVEVISTLFNIELQLTITSGTHEHKVSRISIQ